MLNFVTREMQFVVCLSVNRKVSSLLMVMASLICSSSKACL